MSYWEDISEDLTLFTIIGLVFLWAISGCIQSPASTQPPVNPVPADTACVAPKCYPDIRPPL